MSHPHFVRSLLELNQKCPNDHMRHFDSIVAGRTKKVMYYNRSYLMVVTMIDKKQVSVRVTVRAPSQSLIAEQGKLERSLGVETRQHYANA